MIFDEMGCIKTHNSIKFLAILCFIGFINVVLSADYIPTDNILLNCGAKSEQSADIDGRKWDSDVGSKFMPSSSGSSAEKADLQASSVDEVPFMSARVFTAELTYKFPVSPGRKFVRLYFYPTTYSGMNASNAIFSVKSGVYTLLSNFSAAQTALALTYDTIVKEYSINVEGETLDLTFTPSLNYSKAFAFVNGIEVVSMPDLYDSVTGPTIVGEGPGSSFPIVNTTALEGLYRMNVGGSYIPPTNDTGLFRSWYDDTPYILGGGGTTNRLDSNLTIKFPTKIPSYTAPIGVYSTARRMTPDNNVNLQSNLTWLFSVDSGFTYLVRMHFCEIFAILNKVNMVVFDIYINNQTALNNVDIVERASGNGIPYIFDFVVFAPVSKDPQVDLWLALHPNPSVKPTYHNAFLNGLEIFKLNNSDGTLAGQNPIPAPVQAFVIPSSKSNSRHSNTGIIGGAVGGGVGLLFLVGLLACFILRRRKQGKLSSPSDGKSIWLPLSLFGKSHTSSSGKTAATGSHASSLPSYVCRHFSFAEIKSATKNFDESLVLGLGGFGKVYMGEIDGGTMKVAIKRGNSLSGQGIHEFQTEIELLSKLRHRHLVSLLGYCEENGEMILVYDYMAFGTLREHLYKTEKPPLPWRLRLEICIGSARGLHYLHTGAKHTIIHRDVKTTNILLDEKWVAKVSDFGLSKTGPTLDNSHVSTVVKGSFGYLDPEYFRRQQLTDKSDVYSFGVVLLEILCARPVLNPSLPKEQVSLAEWAVHCYKKDMLELIMDPYLKGKIAPECFKKFAEIASKCLAENGSERPSMGDVLWNLEFALQLQGSAEDSAKGLGGMDFVEGKYDIEDGKKDLETSQGFAGNHGTITDSRSTMSIENRSLISVDSDGLTPSAVFSQIINPEGR